jgi:alanine racemase
MGEGLATAGDRPSAQLLELTAGASRAKPLLVPESPARTVASPSITTGAGIRPTAVEIDLAALAHNAALIAGLTGTAVCAVVKADAYGHGAPAVARSLEAAGAVAGFAVSLVEEGVQLRDAGVRGPVLVMGPAQAGGGAEMVARALTPVVSAPGDLDELAAVARRRQTRVAIHVKVDTGMSRLGVAPSEVVAVVTRAAALGLDVVGVMTHLANADVEDPAQPDATTWAQLDAFDAAIAAVRATGAPVTSCHAANSSGAMVFPRARRDLVRVGLALYGNGRWATDLALPSPRRPALRFVTHVAQLRRVPAGARVGYGGLGLMTRDSLVAVLPVGYADGLPRRITGKGEVLVAGRRCPLVGAVSMDIAIADVTDLAGVAIGDEVVVLGPGSGRFGADHVTTAELAAWAGLSEYEVTCGISKRVPRLPA